MTNASARRLTDEAKVMVTRQSLEQRHLLA